MKKLTNIALMLYVAFVVTACGGTIVTKHQTETEVPTINEQPLATVKLPRPPSIEDYRKMSTSERENALVEYAIDTLGLVNDANNDKTAIKKQLEKQRQIFLKKN